jgi:hypothetical protein
MLHDFTFRSPEEVLASLAGTNTRGHHELVQRTDDGSGHAVGAQPQLSYECRRHSCV